MNTAINLLVLVAILAILFSITYAHRHPGVCEIDPMLEKLRQDLIKIDPRAARLSFFSASESYTEDKEKVFMCLKDENDKYYPYNMIVEVGVHELAHAFTTVVDKEHVTPEFNNEHQRLKKRAVELGILDPKIPPVAGYCPKKN